ncbi:aminotransferase class I/II-fold pyridoxal phosphate-dependent enzyme [uncultured Enterococcus sp.]|uniref:threonine aldolase family protein n=1 Tax=uncultured Enterococcus sp. TaxID=167972 RepID=UPI002AA897DD|nr:aminotransferase class I/II-fold pyridoxal phosphate-dependent enzyme [uncultured Enterococcus sp.]
MDALKESWKAAAYKLGNHGERTIDVLKQVLLSVGDQIESDMYGTGAVIEDFEKKMAEVLGKEAAIFFPSGTMAQQIALRVWTDRKGNKTIAYHPLSHLEIHEEDGLKMLHQIHPILLGEEGRLLTLEDIKAAAPQISCLLLELPQREIGGQLPTFEELAAISRYCREQGILLHLDGARLWECQPYYNKTAAEICSLFDSVYVSFYKGLGGIAGAILAGDHSFITEAKPWKRRHGGDLISLYPYVLSSDYYYEQRIEKMTDYYESAKRVAEQFNGCSGVKTMPQMPVTNMFHVHFSKPAAEMAEILTALQRETGIGFTGMLKSQGTSACSFELSIGDAFGKIPKNQWRDAVQELGKRMNPSG